MIIKVNWISNIDRIWREEREGDNDVVIISNIKEIILQSQWSSGAGETAQQVTTLAI